MRFPRGPHWTLFLIPPAVVTARVLAHLWWGW